MPPIAAVKGTHDVLPGDAAAWEWLHSTHARVAALAGYRLIESPILEHTEMFERGIGAGTDVVDNEMFTFVDRGGRSLTLRPEGTAGVLRAAVPLLVHARPVRVRYAGPMFRYDRPQRGRFRQFHQVGVECLGELAPALDVEVIELCTKFFGALGLAGIDVQVNSLGTREDRVRYRAALLDYYTPLRDGLCADCRRRLDVNPLRLLDCKQDAGFAVGAPVLDDYLSEASTDHFRRVLAGLDGAGVAWTRNHRLVRGLDYYAHTTFEVWHADLSGAQNALAGGGRYDGLAEVLGLPPIPGVGYAVGVERLLDVVARHDLGPVPGPVADALVLPVEPGQAEVAAQIARILRAAGIPTVLDAADRKLGSRLKAADALGAAAAVVIGEAEVERGTVQVKDLAERTSIDVQAVALVAAVRELLARHGRTR